MPEFMLLIYAPTEGGPSPEERMAELPAWFAYDRAVIEAGVHRAGDALHPTETATTVRVRDGEPLVADGPFAESREVLGGYYVLDVPDRATAEEWAAKMPNAHYGSIEVRELVVFSDDPAEAQPAASSQQA